LQAVGVAVPMELPGTTAWAGEPVGGAALDEVDRLVKFDCRQQQAEQAPALAPGQRGKVLQEELELARLHEGLRLSWV
jgi:hypothetical protein